MPIEMPTVSAGIVLERKSPDVTVTPLAAISARYESVAISTPMVGDAQEVRNVMGAVWDGYEVARAI